MMRKLIFLIMICLMVGSVCANPLDDLYGLVFPTPTPTPDPENIINNEGSIGMITNVITLNGQTTVSYQIPALPSDGGINVELFCKDNMGYNMSVWGAGVITQTGSFTTTPQDAGRKTIDGCYFTVVDSTAEMMR